MSSKFKISLEFPDRPLPSELTKTFYMLGELVKKNYVYPNDIEGIQTIGFKDNAIQVKYSITLEDDEHK